MDDIRIVLWIARVQFDNISRHPPTQNRQQVVRVVGIVSKPLAGPFVSLSRPDLAPYADLG